MPRLTDKGAHKQPLNVPPLFEQIIRNDKERAALREQKVVPFDKSRMLIVERRMYTKEAEKMLSWNTNKGKK
jgi:hypothetical protein